MSVVTGALGSLAPKLLQLLQDEYKLQKGVRKQVEWLSRELNSIYAFLRKVSDVPWDRLDEQVKVWVREVREASYDMEDVLDTFLVRVEGDKPADPSRLKRTMKKMSKAFSKAKIRRDIAGAVEDIKKYLEEVAERRQKYKLDESVSKHEVSTSTIDPRLTAMYKEVTQLIGVNKSREELISVLSPSHPDNNVLDKKILKKVSIVGVGGLGKTTLAKAVYDKLCPEYECTAFVSIGRDRDLVTVFKDILFHLDEDKYHSIHTTGRGVDLLIHELRGFLKNKSYFIVVDDVWDIKTWKAIKLALVENSCGSKVITTTRKFDVAEEAGEVYKLKPLSDENSRKLFYTRIFGADGQYHEDKPDGVSDKILKRCAGIPLAITTVASLLTGKPKDEWSKVYNSIGFRHKDNTDVEDTMTILSFSYYDMPSHLQTCLLYLSTYPEDCHIKKDKLIWKWIAEGFVHEKQGERLFEVGERYFYDLINRSMIQAVDKQLDGRVSGCRVHDIVLDLMRKFSFEENFVAILDGNAEAISPPGNVRRFSLHNRITEHVISEAKVIQMPKVRSYIAFGYFINNNWVHILSFRLLRVLDVIKCSFKEGCHLELLGDLLHLRYLGIKFGGSFPKLSKQMTNLKLLQTLVVYGTLPVSIILPTQLLCLYAARSVPHGIGKLTSLQQLRIFGNITMFVKELGSLRELRVLRIHYFDTEMDRSMHRDFLDTEMDRSMHRDFLGTLCNLQKIKKIHISGGESYPSPDISDAAGFMLPRSLHHLDLGIFLSMVPSCINPSCLPNLSYLSLLVDTMDEQDMKHLAGFSVLSCLSLEIRSRITASINAGVDGCFQKLRYFKINAMVQFQQQLEDCSISLRIWTAEPPMPFGSGKRNCWKNEPSAVMPNLQVLHFDVSLLALKDNNYDCGNIGLEYLPSLRELRGHMDFYGVSDEEGNAALDVLRNACKVHPNHPMMQMHKLRRIYSSYSTEDEDEEYEKQEEVEVASQMADIDLGKLNL